jgi:hypothetical protein
VLPSHQNCKRSRLVVVRAAMGVAGNVRMLVEEAERGFLTVSLSAAEYRDEGNKGEVNPVRFSG